SILDAVHERWTVINRSLVETDFARTFVHPELGPLTVETHVHLYGWHSRHHVAHVTGLRQRERW
ncbi:MAG: DinB family protein, partial [Solimonas sp.]